MIKILCIIGNMGLGGAETQLMKIFRAIDREKIMFDFVVNVQEKNYYEDEILALGGQMYRTVSKTKAPLKYMKQLYHIINGQYDVVLKCTENAAAWQEMLIAALAGCRIRAVRSTNTHVSDNKIVQLVHYVSRPILNLLVNVKLAPSADSGEWLFGKRHSKKVKLLHNAIPVDVFTFDPAARVRIRNEWNVKDDEFLIGTVGRMSEQKNQLFLLDVFHRVHQQHPKTKLMIVGDGSLRPQIEQKIQTYGLQGVVMLTGRKNNVPDHLMAMDLFCLPSLYEGMPNCLIEAEATGVVCLAADTITKEANLTEQVGYIPLKQEDWYQAICQKLAMHDKIDRKLAVNSIIAKGYSIAQAAESITKYLLEKCQR